MAIYSGRILVRRGNEINFDSEKLMPGEWALSTDKRIIRICVSPGICIRMATYDAFEKDMEQIVSILQTCQSIESAVTAINTNVNVQANAVAEYAQQTEENKNNVQENKDFVQIKSDEVALLASTVQSKASEVATNTSTVVENTTIVVEKTNNVIDAANKAKESEEKAKESENNSDYNFKMSKSYAVGDTGERIGEDIDNSKYYYENAKAEAERAKEEADKAADIAGGDYATNSQLAKYSLIENTGSELELEIDHSTYLMTIKLKNSTGDILSEKEIDFPIESMVVNASYNQGILTLNLQNGTTLAIDINDIVKGLVSDTFTIAGVDMKDNITASELKAALGITKDDITNALGYVPPTVDTKNTAGANNTSSKIFLVGATSQGTNPTTYTHDTAYVGSDGHLYSDGKQVVNLSGVQALTNKTYNGYTLNAACAKGVATSVSSGNTNLITSGAVYTALQNELGNIGSLLDAINRKVV